MPPHRPELGPCHVWTGCALADGRGVFGVAGGQELASRFAFYLAHGRWPEPCALHHCDNPACVRPEHLFEGTQADNMLDMANKGRSTLGVERPVYSGTRNHNAKLDPDRVREIRRLRATGLSQQELADRFGVAQPVVSQLLRGKTWRHVA